MKTRAPYDVIMDRAIKAAQDVVDERKQMKANGERHNLLLNCYDDSPFLAFLDYSDTEGQA